MSNVQTEDSKFEIIKMITSVWPEQDKLIEEFSKLNEYEDINDVRAFLDKLMIIMPSTLGVLPAIELENTTPNTTSLLYKFVPEYDKTGKVLQKINYTVIDWIVVNSYFVDRYSPNDDLLKTTRIVTSKYENFTKNVLVKKRPGIWISFNKDSHTTNFDLSSTNSVHKYKGKHHSNISLNLSLNGYNILNSKNSINNVDVESRFKTITDLQNKLLNEFTSSTEFVDNFLFELLAIADASY